MKVLKRNPNLIQLYQFTDFDMSAFISSYLNNVNPHEVTDPKSQVLSVYCIIPQKKTMSQRKKGARSEDIIKNKCMYLQDVIIRRAFRKKDERTFSLNSNILKSVIGNEYKPMLEVFMDMGYIKRGGHKSVNDKFYYYKLGAFSHYYTLINRNVYLTEPFMNNKIKLYKEKTIAEIKSMIEKNTYSYINYKHGESFLKRYLTSLKSIRIEDNDGLNTYIKSVINNDNKIYYKYIIDELKEKNKYIYNVDNSGRIYHCLTNLDRNIKQFLNIDIMLDCKNSHPLLFNYFIFNRYNISNISSYNISYFLCNSNISYSNYHNVGKILRNLLKFNNIENESIAKLSDDELEYIYLTSTGQLWDVFTQKHTDKNRSEVKVQLFASVFYSHSAASHRWNEYAKEFKKQFPTVFKLIGDWKRAKNTSAIVKYMEAHHLPFDRGSASLSIAMMALEADIFTTILKRLYAKKWNALHIHDCIIVPKDGNKNHPTIEQVQQIMQEVYKDFGLSPTFD